MNTLKELKELAKKNINTITKKHMPITRVETEFTIVSIDDKQRQFVNCYKCGHKEIIQDKTKFISTCPKCGATQKQKPGCTFDINQIAEISDNTETVKYDLWRHEVDKYKAGDKCKLINGYGTYKIFKDKEGFVIDENLFLQKGKFGVLEKI